MAGIHTETSGPLFFEDLHRRINEIQPLLFDGIRLAFSRPLTPHFQLTHSIHMGMMNSDYRFGANFMGTKRVSPIESYPLIASEIKCDGDMNANFIHMINPRLKAKLIGSFAKHQCTGSQASLDYKGDNFTTSLTGVNIDLIQNSGILRGQLLHQVTNSLSLGPELVVQYSKPDSSLRTMSHLTLGGRFKADKYHVDATVSMTSAHISYSHKANENLHLGVELVSDTMIRRNNASFYYQYDLTSAHTTFKGSIDTDLTVGALLEKRFTPLPITLALSAILNHPKNSTNVGIGLTVG